MASQDETVDAEGDCGASSESIAVGGKPYVPKKRYLLVVWIPVLVLAGMVAFRFVQCHRYVLSICFTEEGDKDGRLPKKWNLAAGNQVTMLEPKRKTFILDDEGRLELGIGFNPEPVDCVLVVSLDGGKEWTWRGKVLNSNLTCVSASSGSAVTTGSDYKFMGGTMYSWNGTAFGWPTWRSRKSTESFAE